jgi:hypothetical protein
MDRRQYAEAVMFFTAAQRYYENLGDGLVADECAFVIALAQRILNDVDRAQKKRSEDAQECAAGFDADGQTSPQDMEINAA